VTTIQTRIVGMFSPEPTGEVSVLRVSLASKGPHRWFCKRPSRTKRLPAFVTGIRAGMVPNGPARPESGGGEIGERSRKSEQGSVARSVEATRYHG
jgi:hypothetical protein